ncbi:hypothetical protein PITCH_A1510001 [uncultured Desulfobacterium sp.]|uniref:PilZ domain-containing protein n=1 Tax=uncultured Desulfobacterium sp. TaxID=201089 RepID=A0A445MTG7_9BACT|nr:hypothetical protein PITCH_A1510001 [uncultured Desulfobacterium sp.]
MEKQKRITGSSRFSALDDLRSGRKPIKLVILGKDYEQVTTVTELRTEDDIPCFVIKSPTGFKEEVIGLDACNIKFEFSSSDGSPYEFITSVKKILENSIHLIFPKSISAVLRRKDFRLSIPQGSRIFFRLDEINFAMNVINISMGGVFAEFDRFNENENRAHNFEPGTILKDVTLITQSDGKMIEVKVDQALIIRSSSKSRPGNYRFGLQFISMSKKDLSALRELIYGLQREFFKKSAPKKLIRY